MREQARKRFFDALGSLTNRIERLVAMATEGRYLAMCAAMMAAQLRRATVQGHARVAMRAGRYPAAGIAEKARSVAAPIQENDHLPATLEMPSDGLHRGLRQPLLARMLAEVDQNHARRLSVTDSLREHPSRVAPLRDVFQRFERRRGGTQDDRHMRALRAPDRQVARRVAKPLMLLERGVVLLVHHNQVEFA